MSFAYADLVEVARLRTFLFAGILVTSHAYNKIIFEVEKKTQISSKETLHQSKKTYPKSF